MKVRHESAAPDVETRAPVCGYKSLTRLIPSKRTRAFVLRSVVSDDETLTLAAAPAVKLAHDRELRELLLARRAVDFFPLLDERLLRLDDFLRAPADVLRVDDFLREPDDFLREPDAFLREPDAFLREPDDFLRLGTLAPSSRASDKPIAIACLRLFTFLPDRPERSVPRLASCIARPTLLPAFLL